MTEVTIAGRRIPLVFNVDSWDEMERTVVVLAKVNDVLALRKNTEKTSTQLSDLISLIRIFGNQGLELDGQERDLTDQWLKKNIKPSQLFAIKLAVINEIDTAMEMETKKENPDEPRDLVLEEINQKKTANS